MNTVGKTGFDRASSFKVSKTHRWPGWPGRQLAVSSWWQLELFPAVTENRLLLTDSLVKDALSHIWWKPNAKCKHESDSWKWFWLLTWITYLYSLYIYLTFLVHRTKYLHAISNKFRRKRNEKKKATAPTSERRLLLFLQTLIRERDKRGRGERERGRDGERERELELELELENFIFQGL